MPMSWCGYFSSRCSLTCAFTSSFQRFKTCRWSRMNARNTSRTLWPLFKTSFISPDFNGRHSTTANSKPAAVRRWQTEVTFDKSMSCCHSVPSSVWMTRPGESRAALSASFPIVDKLRSMSAERVADRFELVHVFRKSGHRLGIGLFLKRCGSFVVVHNSPHSVPNNFNNSVRGTSNLPRKARQTFNLLR